MLKRYKICHHDYNDIFIFIKKFRSSSDLFGILLAVVPKRLPYLFNILYDPTLALHLTIQIYCSINLLKIYHNVYSSIKMAFRRRWLFQSNIINFFVILVVENLFYLWQSGSWRNAKSTVNNCQTT